MLPSHYQSIQLQPEFLSVSLHYYCQAVLVTVGLGDFNLTMMNSHIIMVNISFTALKITLDRPFVEHLSLKIACTQSLLNQRWNWIECIKLYSGSRAPLRIKGAAIS